jgi:hypothetical protein
MLEQFMQHIGYMEANYSLTRKKFKKYKSLLNTCFSELPDGVLNEAW